MTADVEALDLGAPEPAEAGAAVAAPVLRAGSGWRVVARKELADHISSARFYVLLLMLGAAAIVPLYFASDAIRSVASQIEDARNAFLVLFIYAPSDLPIPPVFGFVGIVAPLLGVAFAFDAINSERADGTLPRLLSQPIYRDDVVNGKFAAGLAVITIVLVAVVGVISGFGIVRLGIVPSLGEVVRLVAWLGLSVIWVSLWLAFGLLLSVVIRRAATAALVGFGIWLLVAIFGQLIVGLIAGVVAPVANAATIDEALSLTVLSETILRLLPLTLFQEASRVLLNPSVTTVSTPSTIGQIQQWQQQAEGQVLSFDQSLLLIWPHVVALVALTAICFAAAYIWFMRQEVRA
ncbi:MAG TPA: ABC transporter permease subunit [Candidatus Sulfomarinibacteraceae bacterium]|nr:ABC transporter permease subunit [Candidatus Sulfomarinibacteraceae bacterium]